VDQHPVRADRLRASIHEMGPLPERRWHGPFRRDPQALQDERKNSLGARIRPLDVVEELIHRLGANPLRAS
jgi:hypothetical protein